MQPGRQYTTMSVTERDAEARSVARFADETVGLDPPAVVGEGNQLTAACMNGAHGAGTRRADGSFPPDRESTEHGSGSEPVYTPADQLDAPPVNQFLAPDLPEVIVLSMLAGGFITIGALFRHTTTRTHADPTGSRCRDASNLRRARDRRERRRRNMEGIVYSPLAGRRDRS